MNGSKSLTLEMEFHLSLISRRGHQELHTKCWTTDHPGHLRPTRGMSGRKIERKMIDINYVEAKMGRSVVKLFSENLGRGML